MAMKKSAKRTKERKVLTDHEKFVNGVMRAARRTAKAARKIAKMHGTRIIYMRDGKIVAEKP